MEQPDQLRGPLEKFFRLNPCSAYQATDDGCIIERPWSDDTLQLVVKHGDQNLIESLNSIHLPPRFTAIWHKDTKDLEFIWATTRQDSPYLSRSFEFRFQNKPYRCEFGDASGRLLSVANAAKPISPPTATQYRNLPLLNSERISRFSNLGVRMKASSFWVRDVEWEETRIVEFAQHLNFYMSFYDSSSPYILIHAADTSSHSAGPPASLPSLFPETIDGRMLDPYLLLLWETARTREPFLRFLYLYQIFEYSAFYHLSEEAAIKVKRVLMLPDALARIDETLHRIIDALVDLQQQDPVKIAAVVKLVIEPEALWPAFEIQAHYFASDVTFDGGFHLPPLLREGWSVSDFRTGSFPQIAESYRKIRNALAHGREKRMAEVIHPTQRNADLLEPWLLPLRMMAAHAILYESL